MSTPSAAPDWYFSGHYKRGQLCSAGIGNTVDVSWSANAQWINFFTPPTTTLLLVYTLCVRRRSH